MTVADLEKNKEGSTKQDVESGSSSSTATKQCLANAAGGVSSSKQQQQPQRADTEVEQIAERIERRRAERIPVTFSSRVRFLKDCRRIARGQGYCSPCIHKDDLRQFRDRIADDAAHSVGCYNHRVFRACAILTDTDCLLEILDRAVEVMATGSDIDAEWFYYADFSFDNTRIVSRWPVLRTELRTAALVVLLYYVGTPILFCNVMNVSNICQESGSLGSGWMSALYFASTTMSTVGYGDLSVDQDPRWRSFIGSAYMLLSMVVAVVAFSAAAGSVVTPLDHMFDGIFDRFQSNGGGSNNNQQDKFLYKRLRKVKFMKITEITCQVFVFVLIGVLASQIAVALDSDNPEGQWTWMTSFYWAIQTTTTIGYGDLTQPYGLRWFQIFYLMLATYVVGNSLGRLGSLKEELANVRKQHAWDRRRVTKRFVDEMQAYEHDDKVDQYEFLVASLLSLGKLSSDEIRPIMDKFRVLAGDKGYISIEDDITEEFLSDTDTAFGSYEEDEIDVEE